MSYRTFKDFTLPPRRVSFLARYPRNFKLAVTVVIFAFLVLPPAWLHNRALYAAKHHKLPPISAEVDVPPVAFENRPVDSDVNASALNDQDDRTVKLAPAPDSRVSEDTAEGTLPRISEDGQRPWQMYARPFNAADKRPRVAIIITGLGLSRAITDDAISQLPPTVTLDFDAQAPVAAAWVGRARQDGHEILLDVPMEPFDYPHSDPGPNTLLSKLPNSDNIARLLSSLRHASGYVGITTTTGSRFTTDSTKLAPVLQVVRDRGLLILDARVAPHSAITDMARNASIPVATVTQKLDSDLAPAAIAIALENLEKNARQSGRAVAITSATPIMISQIQAWAKTLPQHGVALAPLSSMVQ